jgi:hypothetical protein
MAIEGATTEFRRIQTLMDFGGKISKLQPQYQEKAKLLLAAIAMLGFGKAKVVSTRRTSQEQEKIYGYGRSEEELREHGVPAMYAKPNERIRTRVLPGESDHEKGEALDIDLSAYASFAYDKLKTAAKLLDVEWGGNWRMRDYGHFGLSKPYNGEDGR